MLPSGAQPRLDVVLRRFDSPDRCSVEHVGLVLAGVATVAFADRVLEMPAGDLFYVPPEPHDSWVVGDEPYVSLHFLGADHYAKS